MARRSWRYYRINCRNLSRILCVFDEKTWSLPGGGHRPPVLDRKTGAQPPTGLSLAMIPSQSPRQSRKVPLDTGNGPARGSRMNTGENQCFFLRARVKCFSYYYYYFN
jgi:hypothetical protein